MQHHSLPLSGIFLLKSNDLAYISEAEKLKPFYKYSAKIDNFEAIIKNKKFNSIERSRLVQALNAQYQQITAGPQTLANIAALSSDNTYTITTAHQPCLLTGPLYFIYKIVDTINLCNQLKLTYPNFNFVPIYWMGGEDHDFEEINHLHLFGKRWVWEDPQGGAVGDYNTTSLLPLLEEIKASLGSSEQAKFLSQLINDCFSDGCDYGTAMLRWVNGLFSAQGLVVLDSRNKTLKQAMIPIFREELLAQPSEKNVLGSIERLEQAGIKTQAHPRAINLFYLSKNSRERIVKEGDMYMVLNTDIHFSQAEILSELAENPQRFSPNVILRPLFQEAILPNLAYVGGGGELAYWLQLQSNFEHFGIPFPMLLRRSSLLWVDSTQAHRWEQWGFGWNTLIFEDANAITKTWLQQQSSSELSLTEETEQWNKEFEQLAEKVKNTDSSLVAQVQAQRQAQLQWLDKLEKRLIKTEKQRHETTVQQISKWKEKLFPNDGLQERSDNFINLYLKYGQAFFEELQNHTNLLDKNFYIFVES